MIDENNLFEYGDRIRKAMIDLEIADSDAYNNGKVLHWHRDTLCGGCFMASDLLCQFLPSSLFVLGTLFSKKTAGCLGNHAWVEANGRVIDLTASQFNHMEDTAIRLTFKFPDIYIASASDLYDKRHDEFFYMPIFAGNEAKSLLITETARHVLGCSYNTVLFKDLMEQLHDG